MSDTRREHLAYLEGIRGWAAVFVAIHHIWQFVVLRPDLGRPPRWFTIFTVFKFGGYAVPVFIVLSGYCLMLPVAKSATHELSGGVVGFVKRRSRRILIPYYTALALVLAFIALHARLASPTGSQWDTALPALSLESIGAHVLLIHNLFPHLQWTIDPPMWSVATEWQIYFLFALVLLPLWRKLGATLTLVIASASSLVPMAFGYRFASPWFVGLFALGMLAATINFGSSYSDAFQRSARWTYVSAVCWIAAAIITLAKIRALESPHPLPDALVGAGLATFLIPTTRRLRVGQPASLITRLLEHRVSMKLGEFSYSTYLIHYPIIAALYLPLMDRRVGPVAMFGALLLIGLPFSLLVAYGFHLLFERPFMTRTAFVASSAPLPAPESLPPAAIVHQDLRLE